jgi:hypothetical protein
LLSIDLLFIGPEFLCGSGGLERICQPTHTKTAPITIDVPQNIHFISISCSPISTCGLSSEGRIYCFDDPSSDDASPSTAASGAATSISMSSSYGPLGSYISISQSPDGEGACALSFNNIATCWSFPSPMDDLASKWLVLSVASQWICGLTWPDNFLSCFGFQYPELDLEIVSNQTLNSSHCVLLVFMAMAWLMNRVGANMQVNKIG